MTTPQQTHVRVQHLKPDSDQPRDKWQVASEEYMEYGDYLKLDTAALANTRARMVPEDEVEKMKAATGE